MPEGPEVKISCDLLRPLVRDHVIKDIIPSANGRYRFSEPEGLKDFRKDLLDCHVQNVQTKGKFMYWTFSNDWFMYSTFGMTGQWSPTAGKHPCVGVYFHTVAPVYFNDPRHFGTIKLVKGTNSLNTKLAELGWDPLARSIQEYDFFIHNQFRTSRKSIGELLMNQGLFAGVGNYIRAEALYLSRLSPWRAGNSLTSDEIDRLQQAIVDVMKESYDHQGATILTYKNAYGAEGKYSSCFKVYGKKTDPLGNTIKKETTPDKRAIHWCPAIQV